MNSIEEYLSKINEGYEGDRIIKWGIDSTNWEGLTNEDRNEKLNNLKKNFLFYQCKELLKLLEYFQGFLSETRKVNI